MINNKSGWSMSNWALYYHSLGFSIIPLCTPVDTGHCIQHGECKKPGKRPLVIWTTYQTEPASQEQIKKWFGEQFPNANIGIITGKISGIVVVDVEKDGPTDGLPDTVKVRSGGEGWHFYYRCPEQLIKSPVRIREKTDIRGEGAVIVVPPSIHVSGKQYEWVVEPKEMDYAEAPDWILKEATQTTEHGKKDLSGVFAGVEEGRRHVAATSVIGKMLSIFPDDEWDGLVWPLSVAWNQTNKPPLDMEELESVFNGISEKELVKRDPVQQLIPISTSDLLNTPVKDIEWVVDRLIQDQGITIISARPGQGKTWIAMAIAKTVALGGKLFNQFSVKKTAVLFIDEENPLNSVIMRIKMLGMTHETPVIWLIGKGIKITSDAHIEAVMKICEENSVGLVIFDSLIRIHNSDENDSRSMARVFEQIRKLTKKNISVLITHHHRKDNFGKPGSHLRGSSDILAAIDYHMAIEKNDSEMVVEQTKARQAEELKPFKLSFEVSQDNKNVSINYAGEDDSSARQILEAKDAITEIVGPPIARKLIINKLNGQFPIKVIDLALNQLSEDGVLEMTLGAHNQHFYHKV